MKKAIFFVVFIFSFIIVGLNLVRSEGITETFDVGFSASYDSNNLEIALELQVEKAYGSKVGLNANISGYDFAFWIVNGVVRYDLAVDHEFIVTGNLDIVAVFDNEDENPVVFMDSNGKLINIQYVENGLDADPPATGSYVKPGYVAAGWSESHLEVTAPTVLVLQYEIDTTSEFLVTVNQGTGSANYLFNTIVTVSPEININSFSHWEVNGEIVSYQEEYSFTVFGSTEITAIFKESPETVKPLITLSDALELHSGKKSFVGQFEFPEGYTLIDYGMITSLIAGSIVLGDEGVVKHTGFKYVAGTNEFLMTFGEESDYEVYRAYLVVEDDLGDLHYYYSRSQYFTDLQVTYLDFEDASKGSYAAESVTLSGNPWMLNDALIGNLANDKKLDSKSLRIQNSGFISSEFAFLEGVENIFFLYAKYGTDANSKLIVQYAYEWDPTNWKDIEEITVDNTSLESVLVDVNINDPIYIRVLKNGGNRVNIDNLIVNYSEYIDDVAPIIVIPNVSKSMIEGESFNPETGVTASDNIDIDLTDLVSIIVRDHLNNIITEPGDFSGLPFGEYTVNYSVTDSSSNTTTVVLTLTIIADLEEPIERLVYTDNFGTATKTGYALGTVTYTNGEGDTLVLDKNRVQINTSTTAPHTSMGAFIVMAPISTTLVSYFEYDLSSYTDISKVEFVLSSWSATSGTAVNNMSLATLKLQYFDDVSDTWVDVVATIGSSNVISLVNSSTYTLVSFETSVAGLYRVIYTLDATEGTSTSNTAYALTIDNLMIYEVK